MSTASDDPPDDLIATAVDYWGRAVMLTQERLDHVVERHSEIRPGDITQAVQRADTRTNSRNRRVGREILWCRSRDFGPAQWLCVVVAYEGRVGQVKTAYANGKGPREADRI